MGDGFSVHLGELFVETPWLISPDERCVDVWIPIVSMTIYEIMETVEKVFIHLLLLLVGEAWGIVWGWRIIGVFNEQLYAFIDEFD